MHSWQYCFCPLTVTVCLGNLSPHRGLGQGPDMKKRTRKGWRRLLAEYERGSGSRREFCERRALWTRTRHCARSNRGLRRPWIDARAVAWLSSRSREVSSSCCPRQSNIGLSGVQVGVIMIARKGILWDAGCFCVVELIARICGVISRFMSGSPWDEQPPLCANPPAAWARNRRLCRGATGVACPLPRGQPRLVRPVECLNNWGVRPARGRWPPVAGH